MRAECDFPSMGAPTGSQESASEECTKNKTMTSVAEMPWRQLGAGRWYKLCMEVSQASS